MQNATGNNNTPKIKKGRKKGSEPQFKPESNQPNIKSLIVPAVTNNRISITVQEGDNPGALNINKKRSPPTPPERSTPTKRITMDSDAKEITEPKEIDTIQSEGDTEENKEPQKPIQEPELSPELAMLHELLQQDMERMMIQPLKERMTKLEKSQEALEYKGELISVIKRENNQLRMDCDNVRKENEQLKSRITTIENRLIANNVVLHGISDQVWEVNTTTCEKALSVISSIANGQTPEERLTIVRKIGIKDIRRVGEFKDTRNRPIVVEFEKKASADFLLENKKKLPKGVYADKEYSTEVEHERRKLRPILRKAKQIPEYKMKSKLEGGALIIKGRRYTSKNLDLLPDALTSFKVSSKETDTHLGFFGELNNLSNFREAMFEVDGLKFHSSEQWIQYQKSKFFNDMKTATHILEATTPIECKLLSKEITNFDPVDWRDHAGQLCEKGITQKFVQNPHLMKILRETGSRTIVECAYDRLWGCGIPLHESNCLNEAEWSGDNLLGKILMKIRAGNPAIIGDNSTTAMDI